MPDSNLPSFDDMKDETAPLPSFDEMKDEGQAQSLPSFDDMKDDSEGAKHSYVAHSIPGMLLTNVINNPEQAGTAAEGMAKVIAGPIATGLEIGAHKLGVDSALGIDTSAEAQNAREQKYPGTSGVAQAGALAGSIFTGVGIPGALEKGAAALLPEATLALSKIGSSVLSSAVQGMGMQAGDELTKSMLGQGDPSEGAGSILLHIGGAGLINGLAGGVFNALGQGTTKGLAALENTKLGDKAEKILAGMGFGAKAHSMGIPQQEALEIAQKEHLPGVKLYYSGLQAATNKAAGYATDALVGLGGNALGGPLGAYFAAKFSDKFVAPIVEKVLQKPLVGINNKLVIPTVVNALSKGQTSGLFNALNYAAKASKGANAVNKGVESLFKGGSHQLFNDMVSERDEQKIRDYIDEGGAGKELHDALQSNPSPSEETPQFAEGGEVQPEQDAGSIANLYPEQNMLLSASKSRMSNYLNSIKPRSNTPKLPFDRKPDDKVQNKVYDNAIRLAAAPLSILKHVKDGTLQAEHMRHMNGMYPDLVQHLQKKVTKRMMESQLDDEKPSYKTRQAMAIFLGSPLAQYQTPSGIQAAQQSFQGSQTPQQGQQQAKTKKGTSNLGKSNKSYQTATESAESDRSGRKA